MSAALRATRTAAARALAGDPRRRQVGWDDLAAWPAWAALDDTAQQALAVRCGAWLHAGALRRCIAGPTLLRLQAALGQAALVRLMASTDADDTALPAADGLEAWLAHEGREALLASVASPVLRVLLRERHAAQTLPRLPALDTARARQAVARALEAAA